jgi:hypothetical protein
MELVMTRINSFLVDVQEAVLNSNQQNFTDFPNFFYDADESIIEDVAVDEFLYTNGVCIDLPLAA